MRRLEAKGYKGLEGLAHSEDESKTEAYKVRLVLGALMGADIWSKHGRLSLPKEVMQQALLCADFTSHRLLPMSWRHGSVLILQLLQKTQFMQTPPDISS